MPNPQANFGSVIDALAYAVETGTATVKELAHWMGCTDRCVYQWMADDHRRVGPDALQVNAVMRRAPADVRLQVALAMLDGSGLSVESPGVPADASQANHDLRSASVASVKQAADLVIAVHDALADHHLDAREREQIRAAVIGLRNRLNDVLASMERTTRIRMSQ